MNMIEKICRKYPDMFETNNDRDLLYVEGSMEAFALINPIKEGIHVEPFALPDVCELKLDELDGKPQIVYYYVGEAIRVYDYKEFEKIALKHHMKVNQVLKQTIKKERIKAIREQ